MIFVPINVFMTHWQVMVIVNASDEVKETEVLFFDSKISGYDPRKKYHFNCDTGRETEELEIDFLKRYLVAILTQDRFLAAITTEHFTPITIIPEITFVNCVQQIHNDCALCVLKNIEHCILHRNELTSGRMSRHFTVGIRTWYDIEVATGLREQIVHMLLDLIRKIEMLEMNNQVVAESAHEENNKVETTELSVQEFNNASDPTSDQKDKDKLIKIINDNLQLDDPSRTFNLYDLGLPGSYFINSELEFQSNTDFVSDNIIEFWTKLMIANSPVSEKFFYVDATLLTLYDNNALHMVKDYCANMKNENIWFFPNRNARIHWNLIVIVNALNNEKDTSILLFESSASRFNPRTNNHFSQVNNVNTGMLESVYLHKFVSFLIKIANPMKPIPKITYVECVQQIGNDCGFCVLKNIEHCIEFSDLLMGNDQHSFIVDAKHWYQKTDATDLRIHIINFLREATGRSRLEGTCARRMTRQKRKACKSASITNYFKKRT